MWNNWNACTLLVGIQHGVAAVKNSLVAPQKIKNYYYHMVQQFHLWVYPQRK